MSHTPINVNAKHKAEQAAGGVNTRIAVGLTRIVGSMPTAYAFALLAFIGLLGILGILSPVVILLVAWLSQTFLQLVFLPILSVGQNVLGRHSELMAEEQFNTTTKIYADTEQLATRLTEMEHYLDQQNTLYAQLVQELQQKPLDVRVTTSALPHEEKKL